jgi:hypothetical protein
LPLTGFSESIYHSTIMEFNKPSTPIPDEHDKEKAPQLRESASQDKNGLGIYVDDEDHHHETPVCLSRIPILFFSSSFIHSETRRFCAVSTGPDHLLSPSQC